MLIKQANKRVWHLPLLFLFNNSFNPQSYVWNRCHNLLMMSMNLSDIAILKMENTGYHCIITWISKTDAINVLQNIDSTEKIGTLEKPRAIWSYKFTRNSN